MKIDIDRDALSSELNDHVSHILETHVYELEVPSMEQEFEAYEHAKRGKCMTCGGPLGEDTTVMVTDIGIVGIWCSGQHLSDMHAISFLSSMVENIVNRVENEEV